DAFPVQTARLPYFLDGDRRKALSRLPRRAREGPRAAGETRAAPRARRTGAEGAEGPPATAALGLEAPHRRRTAPAPRPDRGLGGRRLTGVSRRRGEGERADEGDVSGARQRPHEAERDAALALDVDAPAGACFREHTSARRA